MGLDDPTAKMSKSTGAVRPGHAIGLTDPPDAIRKAIQGAVTDSAPEVRAATAGAGVANLLAIYAGVTGAGADETAARFDGKRYGELKRGVADSVIAALEPVQRRYAELMADRAGVDRVLAEGAGRARRVADVTLTRAKRLMGLARV